MALMKLIFFVPTAEKERVKEALFQAGAGRYEGYDCCSFESRGTGQFRPLEGSAPFIGSVDRGLERVEEYRVELVYNRALIRPILEALLDAHPYEQPAYETFPIYTIDDCGLLCD